MRIKIISILMFLVLTLSGLSSEGKRIPTKEKSIADIFINGFDFRIGNSMKEIKKNLGEPKKIKKEKHVWVEDVVYDLGRYYTLIYDGIEVEVYEENKTKKQFITRLKITSNKYKLKNGINLGNDIDSVYRILGNYNDYGNREYITYSIYTEKFSELKNKFQDCERISISFSFNKNKKINEINVFYEIGLTFGGDRYEF